MSPLSEAEQEILLRLARQVVEAAARGDPFLSAEKPEGNLSEARGAFVTLRRNGELRGCIGHVEAVKPLYEVVRECAVAAALYDPRFEPVTPEELPELIVELSVLSPLLDISPDQLELGVHGLLVSRGDHRGVLLPQVAVELGWGRNQFLEETCCKAGLPKDAWQHGARIQAFTTQIFSESTRGTGGRGGRCCALPARTLLG